MLELCRKTRGAVSIFLIIILLPVITGAGLFLDISRTNLAAEVVSSSADLALNTVLTDYDKDLKDYFGLLASCQDTNEVISVSKQFFIDSMVSADVETSEAEIYADAIFGAGSIADMLQISVEGDVEIERTANGALNNPALIKNGIIEFMKYRSPINGVSELFSKITDSEVAEQMENLSKETQMIEAREAFYSAERNLIKQAEKAYKSIKKYEDLKTHTGESIISENYLHQISDFLAAPMTGSSEGFEAIYKNAHILMVMNLYNTHNTSGGLSVSLLKKSSISTHSPKTTYSESSRAGATVVQKLLKDFNSAITKYAEAKNALQSAWNSVGSMQSGDWPIQYWVKLSSSCASAYTAYVSAANTVWDRANTLENAVNFVEENVMTSMMSKPNNSYVSFATPDNNGNLSLESINNSLWNYYNSNIKSEVTSNYGSSAYWSVTNQLSRLDTSENSNRLDLGTVSHIFNIRNSLNNYVSDVSSAVSLLENAKTDVEKLKKLIEEYDKVFEEWKKIAFDSELEDSELANGENGDRKLIEDLEKNGGLLNLSTQSVTELSNRLGNIKTLFETLRNDMKAIKYRNTPILDVYNYNTFRSAASLDSGRISVKEAALRNYAEETFSFSIGVQIQRIEIYDGRTSTSLDDGNAYVITDSFHPNLKKNSLSLYEWLEYMFKDGPPGGVPISKDQYGFDVSNEDTAEKAETEMTNKSTDTTDVDAEENTSGKSFSEWSGGELPSNGQNAADPKKLSAKIGDASEFVTSLFSDFTGTFAGAVVSMRDDLFTEDYIFSMFTHDVFDNEGCFNQLDEATQSTVKPSNASEIYNMDQWKGSDENMTLTLNPRNAENNWCYGGEIEYILYGSNSNAANKLSAYSQVYLIRYALDLGPVFSFYWDDELLNTVAIALEVFAFIPINFTKTLACLAITAAEAGVDISYLKYGIPVLIYKTNDKELFCNYEKVFLGESKDVAKSNGIKLQYSDYLKIFLFLKLTSDENQVYLRTGDVIQANISQVTDDFGFTLSKSQVFYSLRATTVIAPMWSRLLAIDDLGDISTSKGWRTIEINMKRGY